MNACHEQQQQQQQRDRNDMLRPSHSPLWSPCRYLLISVSSGTQPSNRVWYIDLQQIPLDLSDALDFSGFLQTSLLRSKRHDDPKHHQQSSALTLPLHVVAGETHLSMDI